jgi:hypothetical protein
MLYNRRTRNKEEKIFKMRSESMNRFVFKQKNMRYRRANARENNTESVA